MESEKICPIELILFQVQSYRRGISAKIYTVDFKGLSSTGPSHSMASFRNDDPGVGQALISQSR